jgi:subtilisin family serine protease
MTGRLAMHGRIVLRVRSGEDPADVPNYGDVAAGASHALARFDGGKVERVIRRFTPAMRVSRAFRAARAVGKVGAGHIGWDDLEHETGLSRTYRVDLDPDADLGALVSELAALDVVEMASPHYLCVTPFATAAAAAGDLGYAHRMIGALSALRSEPGDSALIVAIVDSGVDLDHVEFRGRLRPGIDAVNLPDERVSHSIRLSRRRRTRKAEPMDDMGHGSACAALVGARGQRIAPGLAGAARILPVRVLCGARMSGSANLTAVGAVPDIDAGVKTAIDLGARVLNLSFGTPESALREGDPIPHAEIVDYAIARGCVLVAASGNSGDSTTYFPAALPGVIAVGSVGPLGRPSTFSTRGPHVVISAPGEDIPSATIGGYRSNTGTSFAAPFVTGACALLLAHAARNSRPLSPASVRRILMESASPFPGPDRVRGCGAGILDIPRALRALEALLELDDEASSIGAPSPTSKFRRNHETRVDPSVTQKPFC